MTRPFLSLLLLLCATTITSAQEGRWDISATFSPRLKYTTNFPAVNLEQEPADISAGNRFLFDTLTINGTERIFSQQATQGIEYAPIETTFWYAAQVNLHYKIKAGFDFSAGLYYASASYTSQARGEITLQGVVNTRAPFLYSVVERQERTFGGVLSVNYHLFADKKLQPYFGMGLSLLADHTTGHILGQLYTGDDAAFLPNTSGDTMQENFTFNIDFLARMGVLYQITDAWAIGLDYSSRRNVGQGNLGLQIRRRI